MKRFAALAPVRAEVLLIAGALLVIAGFLICSRAGKPSGAAYVTVRGEQVMALPLDSAPDQVVSLAQWGVPAELEVKDGRIRFINVICPDHICEKTGFVFRNGQTAVCMPNRAAVTVAG